MHLPKQSAPVARNVTTATSSSKGIAPSDCGCPIKCLGACVLGHCVGICL
jgi:hypothetical protein